MNNMFKKNYKNEYFKKAFSLIELMVVIGIIAVLSAVIMSNYSQAKAKSRDSKRISDIAKIQLALAQFYDRCNAYPKTIDLNYADPQAYTCPTNTDVSLKNFITVMPNDPLTDQPYGYYYEPGGLEYYFIEDWAWEPTDYQLFTTLELSSPVLKDRAGYNTLDGWTVNYNGSPTLFADVTVPNIGIDPSSNPLIYDVKGSQ